ncbi:MAG: hypothetical protein NVS9B13_26420 [Candidatus Acidiferrum sp.]
MIGGLAAAVIAGAIYFPALRGRVKRSAKLQQQSEEQARRELAQSLLANPGEPHVKATLFWASNADSNALTPLSVELPLSSDPVLRAKQVLNTLLAGPVDVDQRTLPPDAVLLAFYLRPDGLGVADFSEALATSIPSGIQSEQLAVESIARTLEANVSQVRRLKILIHGQEVETLAGHADLTGTFAVNRKAPQDAKALPGATSAKPATGTLTPKPGPGKLPEHK